MKTIKMDISDDSVNTFLTIVSSLKNNMLQNIKVQGNEHYEESKVYFHNSLREAENPYTLIMTI